jgi:uncharacterized membrane protein YbhN (UPF0104 family)
MRDDLLKEGLQRYARDGAERASQPAAAAIHRRARRHRHRVAALSVAGVLLAVGLGVVSWGAESLALWNALAAFGVPATVTLFGGALAALNAGTLVGAVSLLPGGAGAAEATIAAVLVQQTSREIAAAATLLIRLCTLWFGASLGVGALLALRGALVPPAEGGAAARSPAAARRAARRWRATHRRGTQGAEHTP